MVSRVFSLKYPRRKLILTIFCIGESVAVMIPNAANVLQNLALQESFETAAQINEELNRTKFDGTFCKKFKLLIERFSSFSRET